mgnify:FL=1|tara:strand:- start:1221 stop:1439 length:219 start_codon:yes stop_codon:yes gene_type:complete
MFLEYWMITTLFIFFGCGMYSLYKSGHTDGYLKGGIDGHLITIIELREMMLENNSVKKEINVINNDSDQNNN